MQDKEAFGHIKDLLKLKLAKLSLKSLRSIAKELHSARAIRKDMLAKFESYELALDDLLSDLEAKINEDIRNFYRLVQVLKDHSLLGRIFVEQDKKAMRVYM